MSKIAETSLIIKKETKFDKIINTIYQIFLKQEYILNMELKNIMQIKRPNPQNIIIPKEIKSEKHKRL